MSEPIDLNDDSLKQVLSEKSVPVLVSFWAPWDTVSKALDPLLSELAHDYGRRMVVSRVNVDDCIHAPSEHGIKTIPYFAIFEKGEKITAFSGSQPRNKILEIIDSHLR